MYINSGGSVSNICHGHKKDSQQWLTLKKLVNGATTVRMCWCICSLHHKYTARHPISGSVSLNTFNCMCVA